MAPLLKVENLTKRFGGLTAISDVSFSVEKGEILGVIGPNGAGKSTLFNVIAGYHRATVGSIWFDGHNISGYATDETARRGIGRTFQSTSVFGQQTTAENLRRASMMARYHTPFAYATRRTGIRTASFKDMASYIGLGDCLDSPAGSLAYGLQKILGIGMAMMVSPKLLLMDEPAAGLNSSEKRAAALLIQRLRDQRGITVLIVEHDMPLVMGICDRILVINHGKPIALGTPATVKGDRTVIDAYLGEDYEFA